ncbi:F-box domain-containing protein [Rhynchospora pubera]|uniref:F-box domain-containing protein n=1 Tax=Rhynchospora pubera TaxID=906938 RepID=A0AAV8C3A9_9POAL|nr:F-box domain-containing protein [Rhynchospora pubera]
MCCRGMKRERKRDWSDLLPELVHLISKNIPGLGDFIRFRAVCKNWRSVVPLSDAPQQLPWLLEGNGDSHAMTTILQEKHRFYSLFTGETGTICAKPSCKGKSFSGPIQGHLRLFDGGHTILRRKCHLFNPLTEEEVWLPPRPCPLGYWTIHLGGFESWAFFDTHTSKWIAAERRPSHPYCYARMMFISSRRGAFTEFFSVSTEKKIGHIPPPLEETQLDSRCVSTHLVNCDGDLLRVSLYTKCCLNTEHCSYFRIYEFSCEGDHCVWEEISSIDDLVIFLDVVEAFSISVNSFPAAAGLVKPNSIYFLSSESDECKPYRYDIKQGSVQRLPCQFKTCTWFLPTLRTATIAS